MKTIISFDLDMTLLDHGTWTIPDSALAALEQLRKNHIIALATGRDMDNYYSRPYADMVKPDAIIHMNGTKITVGDRLIYEHYMDSQLLKDVMEYAEQKGHSIGVTIGDDDYYIHPEKVVEHDMRRWNESGRNFKDPSSLMTLGVRTLAYIGDEAGAREIESQFPELKLLMFAGRCGADVVEKKASKAQGLIRLCEHFNIPLENTFAFGDSMNDYEIVEQAGTGIAMGNALPELKKAADYITTAIDQDGVWNACRHFGLIE